MNKHLQLLVTTLLMIFIATSSVLAQDKSPFDKIKSPFSKFFQNEEASVEVEKAPSVEQQSPTSVENEQDLAEIDKIVKTPSKLMLDPRNNVGLKNAEDNLNELTDLIKKNQIQQAKISINKNLKWIENATEYHLILYKTLKSVSKAKVQADIEKNLAFRFAIIRDKYYFQVALSYIADNKKRDAVKYLVDIVRSQPKTDLGFSAYEKINEIGFSYKAQFKSEEQTEEDTSEIQE